MIKVKTFSSTTLLPLTPLDGSSLEEAMNTFLTTIDPKNVLDVFKESSSTGKYGLNTTHFGTVVYKV